MLALLLAVIVFAVVLGILVPLLRARPAGPDASLFDQAVYRDQLRELEGRPPQRRAPVRTRSARNSRIRSGRPRKYRYAKRTQHACTAPRRPTPPGPDLSQLRPRPGQQRRSRNDNEYQQKPRAEP